MHPYQSSSYQSVVSNKIVISFMYPSHYLGKLCYTLHWRHNDHDGVSNHQPLGCLLNRLFRQRSKKTSKLRVTALCVGNSPGPVNSPHKGPVTGKMFPFDDVIMTTAYLAERCQSNVVIGQVKSLLLHSRKILYYLCGIYTFTNTHIYNYYVYM